MKVQSRPYWQWQRQTAAFSIMEVLVGIVITSILFVSLYLGISQGYGIVQIGRENQRATQILLEKMETLRLYSWRQVNTAGFIPSTFTAPFYVTNGTESATNEGFWFHGTVNITDPPISTAYSNKMKLAIVTLSWTNGGASKNREMRTFIARYGLQNYIY